MEGTHGRRRLATIFAADVVGYSRLMADDEETTLRRLRAYRDLIDRLIARHDGRIFNTGGDSVLAEFGSAVEAVRCAIAVQDELRLRNAELVPQRRLELRIGINIGDVFVQDGDLLGDGVNVAARLESIARPGGVCISGSTFEQVKNKLSVGFEDLGPQRVKNIPDPVAAFSITTGPVTVAARKSAKGIAGAWPARRGAMVAAAAVVVVAAAAAAFWFWSQSAQGPKPLAAFPESLTTDSLVADDIVALMAGVTISGRRASDDQPFTIVLNSDRSANYSFSGDSGAAFNETGRWWTEDYRFCLQIPRFARGQRACPRIVKSGATLTAVRPIDGVVLPWTLVK
ncbi:adenylate/guanylate cyclase domain-containing protein [Pelagibius marinus]|uniref:adenylate/guanylate cyclase domain-containing protein n=1 Tax=Pelagibius marinus TaxID=2762760 RepID=UPI0018733145|nr:adenylate/guanylate cyclase domain-containing protein [Pelagibius marinus]